MKLQVILRNKGLVLDEEVSYVGAKSKGGEIGILNGHAPLITSLVSNSQLKYNTGQEQQESTVISLDKAFLEVNTQNNNTSVTVITESFSSET